jgi:hypothetical protein
VVEAEAVAASVEVGQAGPARVTLSRSRVQARGASGAALSLWAPDDAEPTEVELHLEGAELKADRIAVFRGLPGTLRMAARGSRFSFTQNLFTFGGERRPGVWRERTTWEGKDNRFDGGGDWLRVGDAARPIEELPGWTPRAAPTK